MMLLKKIIGKLSGCKNADQKSNIKHVGVANFRDFLVTKREVEKDAFDAYIESIKQGNVLSLISKIEQRLIPEDLPNFILKNRIIVLNGDVSMENSTIIMALLLYYYEISENEIIRFYINSSGGNFYDILGIYDTIKFVSCPVQTIGLCCCLSGSEMLLSAGDNGMRCVMPRTKIELDKCYVNNDKNDLSSHKELDIVNNELYAILSESTSKTSEEIKNDLKSPLWLTPIMAKEYGLIDAIL